MDGRAATESRQGNARLFSTVTTLSDGGTRTYAAVTCEAPQAPEFTGCYAFCRNGRLLSRATFKSERLTRRAGEAEASGLELVSESHVDLGMPADVYVTQGHAYVVSVNHATRTGGLTVFDVSNKAAPVKVKTVEMPSSRPEVSAEKSRLIFCPRRGRAWLKRGSPTPSPMGPTATP